jgi:hypothetical protein
MINRIKKMMKRTFAIWVATLATPTNPNNPATIAIIRNITAHVNIIKPLVFLNVIN